MLCITAQKGQTGRRVQRHLTHFDDRQSVRPIFLVIAWTDLKPCAITPQKALESAFVPLNHSKLSTHLKWGSGD